MKKYGRGEGGASFFLKKFRTRVVQFFKEAPFPGECQPPNDLFVLVQRAIYKLRQKNEATAQKEKCSRALKLPITIFRKS